MSDISEDQEVIVCDSCLTASCWMGEFMCEDSKNAGIATFTVRDLKKMNLEHPDNWEQEV